MAHLRLPHFLPGFLAICLFVGIVANVYTASAPLSGVVVAVGAGLLWLLSRQLAPMVNRLSPTALRRGLWLAGGMMLIAQLAVLHWLPDTVYHDPYRVLAQADQMAAGDHSWTITYFWRYPNNVSLAYLLSLWLRLGNLVGLSTNTSIHLLSLLVLDGFIALLLVLVNRLARRNSVVVAAAAFLMLTPFAYTYYLQVFYSDLPAMLVLLAVFGLLLGWPQQRRFGHWLSGTVLIVFVALGQLLKPNLIVLAPALVIVAGCVWWQKRHWSWRRLVPLALILVGFGLSVPAKMTVTSASDFHPDTQFQLPTTHWMLMGLNAKTNGMYAGKDVGHAIHLGSQAAVQRYDRTAIPHRAAKLGVAGLFKLWVTKLGILQRVANVQNWYNGGFRGAPSWYLNHAGFWRQLTAISYQIATVTLLLTLCTRLWRWRPDLSDPTQVLVLLAVTTTLGLFAFHTLLWETEARYGQIVLPLLWLGLAGLPQPQRGPSRRFAPAILAGLALTLGLGAAGLAQHYPRPQVVAAQRSQLSLQYHAKPYTTMPNETLSERITLRGAANHLSVLARAGTQLQVTLSTPDHHHYHLRATGTAYKLHRYLRPGTYTLTVTNPTAQPQAIDVVKTTHYQLAEHPLVINGKPDTYASLVFTCTNK